VYGFFLVFANLELFYSYKGVFRGILAFKFCIMVFLQNVIEIVKKKTNIWCKWHYESWQSAGCV